MRNRAMTVGALMTSVLLLAGACGTGAQSPDPATDATISLWTRDNQKEFINLVADAWNESHDTKVEVTLVPAADFVQKLATTAASGNAPDVASIDLVYLPYFASTGTLEDITELADDLPYKDGLNPSHRALATYNERTYALPFSGEASVLLYNKSLFKAAGLDPEKPPKNYADIISAANKISDLGPDIHGFAIAGQCGGCNVFEFTPHVWASGGEVLSDDGSQARFDSQEVTDALTFYRRLYTDGTMPAQSRTDNGTHQPAVFQSGKVGMVPLGAFYTQILKQDSDIDFGVAPLPGKNGGWSSFAGGDEIAVMKNGDNKEGARDFATWATGEQAQKVLADNSITPVRNDLTDEIYVPLDPRNKLFAEALEKGHTPYSTVEHQVFNDANGPWSQMINKAVFGGDIDAAQKEGQEAAQALLDRAPQGTNVRGNG